MENSSVNKRKTPKLKFSEVDDRRLIEAVRECGLNEWKTVAKMLGGMSPRQCRERWNNYVNPELSKDKWTEAENELLIQKMKELGTKWKKIKQFFPQRSVNYLKTRAAAINKKMPEKHTQPPQPENKIEIEIVKRQDLFQNLDIDIPGDTNLFS